jgi:hypothetical protein
VTGHVILKGTDLVLSAERAEGAPEAIYGVECLMCTAESGLVDNDPKPVEVWALEHTRHQGLAHGQFLVTTQKHWRVDPLHRVPAPGPVVPDAQQRPHRPGAHARPRGRWLARAGGVFGPLLLSVCLFLGLVLFGLLPASARGRQVRPGAVHGRRASNKQRSQRV